MQILEHRVQDRGPFIAIALAIRLDAPIDRIVSWFFRLVVEAGEFDFEGEHRTMAFPSLPGAEFCVLSGVLSPRGADQPLLDEQIATLTSWVATQQKHLGPNGYCIGLTEAELMKRKTRNPNYPASMIGAA